MMFFVVMVIVLGIFPIFMTLISRANYSNVNNTTGSTDKAEHELSQIITDEKVILEAGKYYNESYCEEGLKALLSLAENNLKYKINNNIDSSTIKDELSDEFYNKLAKIYKSVDVSINYQNECVYIPVSTLSKGYTKTNEKYPYIKSVASPWDCENDDFIHGKDYPSGISVNGINYLCRTGMNYKDALSWYLPDFEIK